MARNPKWTRDELILALDLYFEVVELSGILNRLRASAPEDQTKYRNPSSIGMKLHNFARLDSNIAGPGLAHGSKLDGEIWQEFAGNRSQLSEEAAALKRRVAGRRD
jgi:5-methylcytosine-specific restriction protein A